MDKPITRLIWRCKACSDVVISYSHLRHQMDTCDCGKTSVDMEEFYTRILGDHFEAISEKDNVDGKWIKKDKPVVGNLNQMIRESKERTR